MKLQRDFVDDEGNGRRERKRWLFFLNGNGNGNGNADNDCNSNDNGDDQLSFTHDSNGMIVAVIYFSLYI